MPLSEIREAELEMNMISALQRRAYEPGDVAPFRCVEPTVASVGSSARQCAVLTMRLLSSGDFEPVVIADGGCLRLLRLKFRCPQHSEATPRATAGRQRTRHPGFV